MRGVEHIPWAYDLLLDLVEPFGLRRLRLSLVRPARGRVLDLGCGTGRNFDLFDPRARVVGLELDLGLLGRARLRGDAIALVVGRAEELPFRSRVFDSVVSSLVFCSVADPRRGLDETARVLVVGGRLRMLEHVRSNRPFLGWLQDRIQPLWTWLAGGCHPNRDTERTVTEAGFVIERYEAPGRATLRCFVADARQTARGVEETPTRRDR